MNPAHEIEGLVLCQAGGFRFAFAAATIASIGAWELSSGEVPLARTAFGLPPVPGKLITDERSALVVDSLEVAAGRYPLLGVPVVLSRTAGGSLAGFVATADGPVPLLKLTEFSAFVSGQGAH